MGCRHFAAVWGGGVGDKKANSEVVIKKKSGQVNPYGYLYQLTHIFEEKERKMKTYLNNGSKYVLKQKPF